MDIEYIIQHKPISLRIHSHVRGLQSPLQEQPQVSLLSLIVLISYQDYVSMTDTHNPIL